MPVVYSSSVNVTLAERKAQNQILISAAGGLGSGKHFIFAISPKRLNICRVRSPKQPLKSTLVKEARLAFCTNEDFFIHEYSGGNAKGGRMS